MNKYDVFISYADDDCQSMLKLRGAIEEKLLVFSRLTVDDESAVAEALLQSRCVVCFNPANFRPEGAESREQEIAKRKGKIILDVDAKDVEEDVESVVQRVEDAIATKAEDIEALMKAAERGDADAQCELGRAYFKGWGVAKDFAECVKWYIKSAEQGNANAQNSLGNRYYSGKGVEQNYAEAAKWFLRAAHHGVVHAQDFMRYLYSTGTGVPKDIAKAVEWARKAAQMGNGSCQLFLGSVYYVGQGVEKDKTECLRWLEKAAEQNISDAYLRLSFCYYGEDCFEEDDEKAFYWTKKAAENGIDDGQLQLGYFYHEGIGTEKDSEAAFGWYMKAAEQGHDMSQSNIGLMYKEGDGVEQDYEEAVRWFRLSAEQENEDAQYYLGHCYREGKGVEQNDTMAVEWYRRAADNGRMMGPVMDYIMCYLDRHPEEHFDFDPDDTPWGDGPLIRVDSNWQEENMQEEKPKKRFVIDVPTKVWFYIILGSMFLCVIASMVCMFLKIDEDLAFYLWVSAGALPAVELIILYVLYKIGLIE